MAEIRILADPKLRPELKGEGLLDLDALCAREDLHTIKARLTSRQTYRLQTSGGHTLYLKLYHEVEPPSRFAGMFAQRFDSPASREWHVLEKLHEIGVPTMRGAACIEEVNGGVKRAALLTIGLDAQHSLQTVLMEEFGEYPQPLRRQKIARDLGGILKQMHEGGVNHRDFYLVHIRVGHDDTLYVTDLNRADIRKRVTRRWRVKDLAALLHSAPHSVVTNADKARVAKVYFGGHLRDHRSMIQAVIRKADRMTAHTRKRLAQGESNYHVVE
ncbi:MAG: hypothetical protein KDB82_16870 [Planctomycetes bacterium]|nr:hypothetical protein [Planctomycetota bacterium]